jgi:type I restriction enzyme, S subunit
MSFERKKVKLGDIVDIFTGFPFKSAQYSEDPADIKLIRGDNIAQGALRWDGVKRWPAEKTETLENFWLKENDVLLAMDRPWIPAGLKFARVYSSDLPCLLVQRVACLRAKSGQDQNFIYSLLSTPTFSEYIQNVTTGTAVPHISVKQIKEFELEKLTLAAEREIGLIHGIVDSRIKLLREINATLEAIAQALFKSWFVDFDPVHANAGTQTPSLPAEIQALFPSRLVESTQGLIPEGWEVGCLSDLCSISSGKRPEIRSDNSGDSTSVPLYGGAGIMGYTNRTLFDGKKILTGRVGTLGKVHIATPPFWASDNVLVLTPKSDDYFYFSLNWLMAIDVHSLNRGSTQPLLTQKDLGAQLRAIPPKNICGEFDKVVLNIYLKIESNNTQADSLSNLRDTLLPRLISGQLRLPEAEAALAEV